MPKIINHTCQCLCDWCSVREKAKRMTGVSTEETLGEKTIGILFCSRLVFCRLVFSPLKGCVSSCLSAIITSANRSQRLTIYWRLMTPSTSQVELRVYILWIIYKKYRKWDVLLWPISNNLKQCAFVCLTCLSG